MMEDSLSSKQEVASKTGHMTPEEVVRHLESRRYDYFIALKKLNSNLSLILTL